MKTFLMLVIMLSMWCLPASVQGGSNNVDLEGKGLNHLNPRGENALSAGRKAQDLLSAQQGRKALADVKKSQAKSQADTNRAMQGMQKIKMPQTSMPDIR